LRKLSPRREYDFKLPSVGTKNRKDKRAVRLTTEQLAEGRASGHLLTVTRKEILVGLLDTAIWLWFMERDHISIHTLASAAHRTLRDLGRTIEKTPTLNQIYSDDELRQAYNIFKHASDGDLNEITDFPPETNVRLLLDASNSFFKIFGSRTAYMGTFTAYVVIVLGPKAPVGFVRPEPILFLPENTEIEDVIGLKRLEFFNKIAPLFEGSPLL
jgi:hypothetical protein